MCLTATPLPQQCGAARALPVSPQHPAPAPQVPGDEARPRGGHTSRTTQQEGPRSKAGKGQSTPVPSRPPWRPRLDASPCPRGGGRCPVHVRQGAKRVSVTAPTWPVSWRRRNNRQLRACCQAAGTGSCRRRCKGAFGPAQRVGEDRRHHNLLVLAQEPISILRRRDLSTLSWLCLLQQQVEHSKTRQGAQPGEALGGGGGGDGGDGLAAPRAWQQWSMRRPAAARTRR
jgi:hypothetical protein